MVKRAKIVCALVGIALLAVGCWWIRPAYGMITVGVWCIVVSEVGALGVKLKRKPS